MCQNAWLSRHLNTTPVAKITTYIIQFQFLRFICLSVTQNTRDTSLHYGISIFMQKKKKN